MGQLSADEAAREVGVKPFTLREWARKGWVPSVVRDGCAKARWYDLDELRSAVARLCAPRASKTCLRCSQLLPLDQFRFRKVDTERRWPSSDCNDCHKAYNLELRIAAKDAAGKVHVTRREALERRAEAARTKAIRYAAYLVRMEELRRTKLSLTAEERETLRRSKVQRSVDQQRWRYNNDPDYQARCKAKKIRRKRAINGSKVEPVNREVVAARDGWRCAICGKRVTRKTWSLDHVVPLAQGGDHGYHNLVLAHRRCNSRRGPGRLPSQAPLFPRPA